MSTIFQFYTLEFGFEECQITISLPANHTLSPASPPKPVTSVLDVFLLANPSTKASISDRMLPISESMTYSTRPSRLKSIGRLALPAMVKEGGRGVEARSEKFKCEERVVQTVELACAEGSECDMDFWQDKYEEGPRFGMSFGTRSARLPAEHLFLGHRCEDVATSYVMSKSGGSAFDSRYSA